MTKTSLENFVDDLNELCEQYGVRLDVDCNCLIIDLVDYRPWFLGTIYETHAFLDDC